MVKMKMQYVGCLVLSSVCYAAVDAIKGPCKLPSLESMVSRLSSERPKDPIVAAPQASEEVCRWCDMSFSRLRMHRHILSHIHGVLADCCKPFTCAVCNDSFWEKAGAKRHLKMRHPGVTDVEITCNERLKSLIAVRYEELAPLSVKKRGEDAEQQNEVFVSKRSRTSTLSPSSQGSSASSMRVTQERVMASKRSTAALAKHSHTSVYTSGSGERFCARRREFFDPVEDKPLSEQEFELISRVAVDCHSYSHHGEPMSEETIEYLKYRAP